MTGAHELDAANFTCGNCGSQRNHGMVDTFNTYNYFPCVPTELAGDPASRVTTVISRRFASHIYTLQNYAVRTSTTGIIAAADAAAMARGGRKKIRPLDFYAAMREFGYLRGTMGKWVEEQVTICPCCQHTGCRLGTDGNRKMVLYNAPCKNCGVCWSCRHPDGYHAVGTKDGGLWVADDFAKERLHEFYPDLGHPEAHMCGQVEHKVLRQQHASRSQNKQFTGIVAGVCVHYIFTKMVAMEVSKSRHCGHCV